MSTNSAKRIAKELAPEEQERLKRQRELIAKDLPDLAQRDQLRKEAQEEAPLSAELRRAIHASQFSLAALASQVGITPLVLDEFLTGERTLRSDVMDRLAAPLGFRLQRAS